MEAEKFDGLGRGDAGKGGSRQGVKCEAGGTRNGRGRSRE